MKTTWDGYCRSQNPTIPAQQLSVLSERPTNTISKKGRNTQSIVLARLAKRLEQVSERAIGGYQNEATGDRAEDNVLPKIEEE